MVNAILYGRKTQTRRVVKQPRGWPQKSHCDPFGMLPAVWWWKGGRNDEGVRQECPYGQLGDRLWVRESFWDCGSKDGVYYCAEEPNKPDWGVKKRPSIHMPRWASRITLEIVGVRVERLQKISNQDVIAEGIFAVRNKEWDIANFPEWKRDFDDAVARGEKPPVGPSPRLAFSKLWESINGPGSWEVNPWVWVIEFVRLKP